MLTTKTNKYILDIVYKLKEMDKCIMLKCMLVFLTD